MRSGGRCFDLGYGNFTVSDVMIDVLGFHSVAGFECSYFSDYATLSQLIDDVISFGVGVGIRGVGHLEGQSG